MGALVEGWREGRTFRRWLMVPMSALVALALPGALQAEAPDGDRPTPRDLMAGAVAAFDTVDTGSEGVRYRLAALGGAHGIGGDDLHVFGGVEAGALYGRFGAMALTQFGGGGERSSILVGGGPAVEVVDLGTASLTVYGGLGWYQETLDAPDVSRDLTGAYGGASVRVPLPAGAVAVGVSLWRGSLGGDGVLEEPSLTGRRLSVGYGF